MPDTSLMRNRAQSDRLQAHVIALHMVFIWTPFSVTLETCPMTLTRPGSKLFGSRTRTSILVLLALLNESYAAELAKMLGVRSSAIKKIVDALEVESVIAGRLVGRTRVLALNPRYVAAAELKALLWKLGERDTELQTLAATKRKRPRRSGKPI